MTTAPAYGADARDTGTVTARTGAAVPAEPARAVPRGAAALRGPGRIGPGPAPVRAARTTRPERLAATGSGRAESGADATARAASAPRAAQHTDEAKAAPSRELSSTSAVGLVLAGGAILVIAGQLLRLRLRLRRERRGDADER
ncbi:hypothetical protein [Streptomyces sp. NPDC058773]|uniref:hypothetical protein n=1 Tax=Streptomyces sp. NPDC058773 TaxID=3346632 RepID=UPI0036C6CE14